MPSLLEQFRGIIDQDLRQASPFLQMAQQFRRLSAQNHHLGGWHNPFAGVKLAPETSEVSVLDIAADQ